jgi:hypothetical protein
VKLFAIVVAVLVLTPTGAEAKKPPKSPPPPTPSTTSTYVKNYANVVNGVQYDLTPEVVQATPDGGAISLALTQSPGTRQGVSWLIKTNAVGAAQWQEEVGCLTTGTYADTVSLQRTSDGGYVLAGGTVGCGSGNDCPELSGIQCALVERLDSAGGIVWARVYDAGAAGSAFTHIEQTSDGGFIAVGNATDLSQNTGALIMKLDGSGNVQWARELGPTGSDMAYFKSVRQTPDGGYIAAGELDVATTTAGGLPKIDVLAVKLDGAGNVEWQHGFESAGGEHVETVITTADGGFAIGGNWTTTSGPGTCCHGGLLLKLTADGSVQSQVAYSAGVYCFDNGYSETCTAVGGDVYSLQQEPDGGYVLAGDANLELLDEAPIVPWLARVDSSGGLVWQEQDYQILPATGRPLSEYFASSTLTPEGPLALGWTENYGNGLGELFGVQTDANGAVGTCSQIHPETTLNTVNPGLTEFAPGLATSTPSVSVSPSPAQVLATSAGVTAPQC